MLPEPGYDPELAFEFVKRHGTAIRAIGIRVEDAHHAYSVAHRNGAVPVLSPTELRDNNSFGKQVVQTISMGLLHIGGTLSLPASFVSVSRWLRKYCSTAMLCCDLLQMKDSRGLFSRASLHFYPHLSVLVWVCHLANP